MLKSNFIKRKGYGLNFLLLFLLISIALSINPTLTLGASSEAQINVTKDNFLDYFSLGGDATYSSSDGIATFTKDTSSQVGSFSLNSKIDTNTSFTLKGAINIGSNTSGADGIGFAFHTGNTTDTGMSGAGLGIAGLQKATGFKIDTYKNGAFTPTSASPGSQIPSSEVKQFGWAADSGTTPYGTFVTTSDQQVKTSDGTYAQRWWAEDVSSKNQPLSTKDIDGSWHDFSLAYDGSTRTITVNFTQYDGTVLTWTTTLDSSYTNIAFTMMGSTGDRSNLQQLKFDSFGYQEAATINVTYVDSDGNVLEQGEATYPDGAYVNGTYTTEKKDIAGYNFNKMDDGTVTGTKSLAANGTLNSSGSNGSVIYVYEPNTYNVKYNSNTGSGSMDNQLLTYNVAQNLSSNTLTKPGYTFSGWNTSADGTGTTYTDGQSIKNLTTENGKTITLYAQWTVNDYTVSFDANSGIGNMADQSFVYDVPQNLTTNSFTKEGYTFLGWNTKKDNTGVSYYDGQSVTNLVTSGKGKITFYAQWAANENTISFNANGGETEQENIAAKTDEKVDLTDVLDAMRPGYTFDGWYTTIDGDTKMPSSVQMPSEAIIYYAHWTANTYTVAYAENTGTGAMENQAFTFDVSQSLETNTFIKTGYLFEGWNTAADGSGTNYTDGQSVKNLTTDNNGTVTLYAQWINNTGTATVTYVDDTTGENLSTVTLSGLYGTTDSYRTKDTIDSYKSKKYKLVSDNYPSGGITFTEGSQSYEVHLKHDTTVTEETKVVTETIHYVYDSGKKAADDYTIDLTFKRTITTDSVTGEITTGSWTPTSGTFAAVNSPSITGYKADKTVVPAINGVTGDTTNIVDTVTYTKKDSDYTRLPLYRLYNPNSGEHFYTLSEKERDHVKAAGWTYEGVAWITPSKGNMVYRLYNPNGGEHLYTKSNIEYDSVASKGWIKEGVAFRSSSEKSIPIYRAYNPNAFANNHLYTKSLVEKDWLVSLGWRDENICFYAVK